MQERDEFIRVFVAALSPLRPFELITLTNEALRFE
jgi:hypothetical protein